MGKEMNKKQMCASVCLTRIPFFLFMQQATLEVRVETWICTMYFRKLKQWYFPQMWLIMWHQTKLEWSKGKKNKQTPNGKQGSPPLLLEIAATVPPISSSLYVQFKGSTHQIHIAPGRGGAWVWTSKTFLQDRCQRGRHKAAGIFVLL